jgi:hypothetical protein
MTSVNRVGVYQPVFRADEIQANEVQTNTGAEEKKLSTEAQVGIGAGLAALASLGTYLVMRGKGKPAASVSKAVEETVAKTAEKTVKAVEETVENAERTVENVVNKTGKHTTRKTRRVKFKKSHEPRLGEQHKGQPRRKKQRIKEFLRQAEDDIITEADLAKYQKDYGYQVPTEKQRRAIQANNAKAQEASAQARTIGNNSKDAEKLTALKQEMAKPKLENASQSKPENKIKLPTQAVSKMQRLENAAKLPDGTNYFDDVRKAHFDVKEGSIVSVRIKSKFKQYKTAEEISAYLGTVQKRLDIAA